MFKKVCFIVAVVSLVSGCQTALVESDRLPAQNNKGNGQVGTVDTVCGSNQACLGAQAVFDVLQSKSTPKMARELLVASLNGPTKNTNTAILSNTVVDAAAGTAYRSIQVGVDDLKDEDNGWGTVYEILVKTVGGKVVEVKVQGIAG